MTLFLPAQDESTRGRRRKWLIAGIAVLAVAAIAAGPGRALARKAHGRKLLAEAEAYAAQNRPDAALTSVRAALSKGQEGTRTLRLLLDLNGRVGNQEALRAWTMLAARTDLAVEDRRELLRWAVAWGHAEWADAQWRELAKERPIAPATARVAAGYFQFRGEPKLAVEMAQEAIAANAGDTETRVFLGKVLIKHGNDRDQVIGKRLLMETAERPDAFGLAVLQHLASSRTLLPYEAQQCLSWLERNAALEKPDVLTAADLRMQITPYRRDAIIAETAKEVASKGGDILGLGRWLAGHGAFHELLAVLPTREGAKSKELALLRLDVLAQTRQWETMEKELEAKELAVPPFESALYRARAATALNRTRVAELQWKQAEELARRDARSLGALARFAAISKEGEIAERAWRSLTEQPAQARGAWEQLLRSAWASGSTEKARTILMEMRVQYPEDLAVQNDLTYLELLIKTNLAEACGRADQLHRSHPERWAFRATLALSRLRQDRPAEAVDLLTTEGLDWEETPPGHRAIYVAALNATGKADKAAQIARSITREDLKPEEFGLIAGLKLE